MRNMPRCIVYLAVGLWFLPGCPEPGGSISPDVPADIADGLDVGGDARDIASDLPEVTGDALEVLDAGDAEVGAEVDADVCVPLCEELGLECGDDGCGGSCGLCDPGFACVEGLCLESGLPGTPCDDDVDCDDGPCIGPSGELFCSADCVDDEDCPEGWECVLQPGDPDPAKICIPPCPDAPTCEELDAECGFVGDGCGTFQWCGECDEDAVCSSSFLCVCLFLECGGECCAEGEFCVDDLCTSPCDPPCGECEDCVGGACQPKQCDPPCEVGFHCDCGICAVGGKPGDPCGGDGDCAAGLTCIGWICCTATDATCDGVDDDCDGDTDDDYVPVTECGEGVCLAGATPSSCVGGIETPCQPGPPLADMDTTCDEIDDDCDGVADDDYVADDTCGVGACQTGNTPSYCVQGEESPCVAGEPLADDDTTCDGADDDCDGETDEDYVIDDSCGIGWCQVNNTPSSCVDGEEIPCDPGPPASADTSCNGVDDDCDDDVDDDYIVDDSCGVGVCQMGNTPSSCVDGFEFPCVPGPPIGETDAVCDGLDDDCDGSADEDYVPNASCGTGYCQFENTPSSCVGGMETLCVPGEPLGEVDDQCDYIDDDCDGETDEDADPPCATGTPVPGATVAFLPTLGTASGIVADNGDGTYASTVMDLTNPGKTGEVSAVCNGNVSDPIGFEVIAGALTTVDLAVSRPEVCADDAAFRACARVTDDLGAPAASDTAVLFTLDLDGEITAQSASSQGDGLFCAWITAPGGAFDGGASGTVQAKAAGVSSDVAALDAIALPAALNLGVGEVGLRLPLCARLAGSTFIAPVIVNTGDHELGSYNISCAFDGGSLTVLQVAKGAAASMGDPVPSIADGSVSFTAINAQVDGTAKGPAVEVALITFKVKETAGDGDAAAVNCEVQDLFNTNLVSISANPDVLVYDGDGQGTTGFVDAASPAIAGLFATLSDNALINMALVSGEASVAFVKVLGLWNDGVLTDVAQAPGTICEATDPGVGVAAGCAVTGTGAGVTTVTAVAGGFASETTLWVLGPQLPAQVSLSDANLRYIPHIDRLQEAQVEVVATFTDGDLFAFDLDVTAQSSFISMVPAVAQVDEDGVVTSVDNGASAIVAFGAFGDELGSANVQVEGGQNVSVTDIHVVVPATIKVTGLDPKEVPDALGEAAVEATVTNLFDSDGQQVQASVQLVLSDDEETGGGSRIDVTDWKDAEAEGAMSFGSSDGSVITVDEDGLVTAVGSGDAQVQATFENNSSGYTGQGDGAVEVQLPPPQSVDLNVADPRLALGAADTAHTILGLPTARQLQVIVHFVNGTSKDFTALSQTHYAVTGGFVTVTNLADCAGVPDCAPGRVETTGIGVGTALVTVTFPGTYLDVVSAQLEIEVVSHDQLVLKSVELHTPAGVEPAPEQTLSWVECVGTRQQARLIVEEVFTDGSVVDLTGHTDTTYGVYAIGTSVPDDTVVAADPLTDRVTAVGLGTVDIRAMNGTHESAPLAIKVDDVHMDIVDLDLFHAAGATLHGVRDVGTGQLDVTATFTDGTHMLLTGPDFIPGLLVFSSHANEHATVDATGLMTAKGNGPAAMTVDLADDADCEPAYDVVPGLGLQVNLLPVAGDVDMGFVNGLAFPDQAADAVFQIPVRVNTGGKVLGGIDLEIDYDQNVILAVDVEVGGDIPGAIFNGNLEATPGVIYLNASPSLAAPVSGSGVEVAVLTFQALKSGGPVITFIGGTVVEVVDAGGAVIGEATPKPIVAGAGLFDPPPGGVWGDANDDELFSIADVLFVQQIIVEPPLVIPNQTQVIQSDLFPDGVVASNDAFYASRALARLVHFVDASAEEHSVLGGHFDITVVVTDRDQLPVDENVQVRIEVAVEDNLDSITFTNAHDLTENGVITTAVPSGSGQYKTHVSGLVTNEALGVVVILDVLDNDGAVIASTSYLGTPTMDPAATFKPLFEFGEFWCVASCDGAMCGDSDGCDGTCSGPCPYENELCIDGTCLCGGVTCVGKACGDDNGCGGLCNGPCPGENELCVSGACVCDGTACGDGCCAAGELCEGGECVLDCTPACDGAACGDNDGCGGFCDGTCPEQNQFCTDDFFCACEGDVCGGGCCPLDHVCLDGQCCEVLSCTKEGWECGAHYVGCETYLSCGSCGEDGVCTLDFQCDCVYEKCAGTCCGPMQICVEGECFTPCVPDCGAAFCGDGDGCEGVCNGPCQEEFAVCVQGQCECEYTACDAGCCPEGWECQDGACEPPCEPDCLGKLCGDDDTCGGLCLGLCMGFNEICMGGVCACAGDPCGEACCAFEEICQDGVCVVDCDPQCDGLPCGEADSCGGLCQGACPGLNETCVQGQCQCAGAFCDGACCPAGQVCNDGICCTPLTCPQFGDDACGMPQDGCGGILLCGGCGEDEFCDGAFTCQCEHEACGDGCCGPYETCEGGLCVPECLPSCGDAACGDADGCGGACFGPCPHDAQFCVDGVCFCMGTDCSGKACGDDDGCGGLCPGACGGLNEICVEGVCVCLGNDGALCDGICCPAGYVCENGECVIDCQEECDGAACGDDNGCGGLCDGSCPGENEVCTDEFVCACAGDFCDGACCAADHVCYQGACCPVDTCEELGAACGTHFVGCGTFVDCGDCGTWGFCDLSFQCQCEYLVCGGECCVPGDLCVGGECTPPCEPDCEGMACGADDGCGGACFGPCPGAFQFCLGGQCLCENLVCGDACCAPDEDCVDGVCATVCQPACAGKQCGDSDGCGGACSGPCPGENEYCLNGACVCAGGGGLCGGVCCGVGEICDQGACVPDCAPVCDGAACGDDDGCGGACSGPCPGPDEDCVGGICLCAHETCGGTCCPAGDVCDDEACCTPITCAAYGDIDCGALSDGCGGVLDCGACASDEICDGQHLCVCAFEACGDACCAADEDCIDGACVPSCPPDCPPGAACGDDDGCGGACFGPCPGENEYCFEGICVCAGTDCLGKACGEPDGCSGVCLGVCPGDNEVCVAGECACAFEACGDVCCPVGDVCKDGVCKDDCDPDCEGADCGDADGCGGFCDGFCPGENTACSAQFVCECAGDFCAGACCPANHACYEDACCQLDLCEDIGAACGVQFLGCGTFKSCGECGENEFCTPDAVCDCQFIECHGACCADAEACHPDPEVGCTTDCIPLCAGLSCGAFDGCGGLCDGPCPGENEVCVDGACECEGLPCAGGCCPEGEGCVDGECQVVCIPACDGADCGASDSCFGLCQGPCPGPNEFCASGECLCVGIGCGDGCCAPGETCEEGICTPCQPSSCGDLGVACGFLDDGCGNPIYCGACGPFEVCDGQNQCACENVPCGGGCCPVGEACEAGACVPCLTDCTGAACGDDDGCGGLCDGDCPGENEICDDGACVCQYKVCGGFCCAVDEYCLGGECTYCVTDCAGAACGDADGCGGLCDGTCPGENESCDDGVCVCGGVTCGDACCSASEVCQDGACACGGVLCGGVCCDQGEVCNGGVCCAPDCDGALCGASDGCVGYCFGDCPGENQVCIGGQCLCAFEICGDVCCPAGEICQAGACTSCTPICFGASCGDADGCGGYCDGLCDGPFEVCLSEFGYCACEYLSCQGVCCDSGEACLDGACVDCTPDCVNAACGDANGCGGACFGPCPGPFETCNMGACQCINVSCGAACCDAGQICAGGFCCTPDCAGKTCGQSDGCGGACAGPCDSPDATCVDGQCVCDHLECYGECCAEGATCENGGCCLLQTCEEQGAECGFAPTGCGNVQYCGACGPDLWCGPDFTCQCLYEACGDLCCGEGEICQGGVCVEDCTPDCSDKACGADNGCGGICLDGYCVSPHADCLDGVCACMFAVCLGECCAPTETCEGGVCCDTQSCDDLGAECGETDDGCGNTIDCGGCPENEACGEENLCECEYLECETACCAAGEVCENGACCTQVGCQDLGAECGVVDDGCGNPLFCGGCGPAEVCSGDHVCECEFVECEGVCCAESEICMGGVCEYCESACDGKACGDDDGCGNLCDGACPGQGETCEDGVCVCFFEECGGECCVFGEVCHAGACCAPAACDALGASCGYPDDGCGTPIYCGGCPEGKTCGPDHQCGCLFEACGDQCCAEGESCVDGQCECAYVECDGVCCAAEEDCVNGICCIQITCDDIGAECGSLPDGCGGLDDCGDCGANEICGPGYQCECLYIKCAGICCAYGDGCLDGVCGSCTPECNEKACGEPDGCGGLCIGPCPLDQETCVDGVCVCAFLECGGVCCAEDETCEGGVCTGDCISSCAGKLCGEGDDCGGICLGPCPGAYEICEGGTCVCQFEACGDECCGLGYLCVDGACCAPQFCSDQGAECGVLDDGCGTTIYCGACGTNAFCKADHTCDCLFIECGGSCCADGEACQGGVCACVPDCSEMLCGQDDGCGGLCDGPCADPFASCVDNVCQCQHLTCDGTCCSPDEVCHQGVCCSPLSCVELGAGCGLVDDGCGGEVYCGACPGNEWCTPLHACECLFAACDGDVCCEENETCVDGSCQCPALSCGGACCGGDQVCYQEGCCSPATCGELGAECGTPSDGCGSPINCGGCGLFGTCGVDDLCACDYEKCDGACCSPGEYCIDGACTPCVPDCPEGVACGASNGCGGQCIGACLGENEVCLDGACQCQNEACGGGCCAAGEVCADGACCVPDCAGAVCGDSDGCGGLCQGACAGGNETCVDGACQCAFVECGGVCCDEYEACEAGQCATCVPLTCGDFGASCGGPLDGCGGVLSCGSCGPNQHCDGSYQCACSYASCAGSCCGATEVCAGGACCTIDCEGKACGDSDGCGGLCYGTCPGPNQACVDGACACEFTDCQGACCASGETCQSGACCAGDCDGAVCGDPDGCGGVCDGACAGENELCVFGQCLCSYVDCDGICCGPDEGCSGGACCTLQCDGAACGDPDGCGGLCDGTCPGSNQVCLGGACQCQYTQCSGSCCGAGEVCADGSCCAPVTCAESGADCGSLDDGCGVTLNCGSCGANATCSPAHQCECLNVECDGICCNPEETCVDGECFSCVPDCIGKACGDSDGCGGLCDGACLTENEVCVEGICECAFVECGGLCCAEGEPCEGGQCTCTPDCAGKLCGQDDGCGGVCAGACLGNEVCVDFTCVCQGLECGDQCCADGQTCVDGACCSALTCGDLGATCGLVDDGCGEQIYCGACGLLEWCDSLHQCGCLYEDCDGTCCVEEEVCHAGACCVPQTCEDLGAECGAQVPDGCGATLDCGTCAPPRVCDGTFQCACEFVECGVECCPEGVACVDGFCGGCVPLCVDTDCGDDDGCGGLCDGACPNPGDVCVAGVCGCGGVVCDGECCSPGQTCYDGACCTAAVSGDCAGLGAECGNPPDGCGGTVYCGGCDVPKMCGPTFQCGCPYEECAGVCCDAVETCLGGACVCAFEECGGLCCEEGVPCSNGSCCEAVTCQDLGADCGEHLDGCGGILDCGACGPNAECQDTDCVCVYEECQGVCCEPVETCVDGVCTPPCEEDCEGKNCGDDDGCGGFCDGPCASPDEQCVLGQCVCQNLECGGVCCGKDDVCFQGACCTLQTCADVGAACGAPSLGCGEIGDCGTCDIFATCDGTFQCICDYLECGGTCCAPGDVCDGGDQCCLPDCTENLCGGDDGCGGICLEGACPDQDALCSVGECICMFEECLDDCCAEGEFCIDEVCTLCTIDCDGKNCGDSDGCGGFCPGPCPGGNETCVKGECICSFDDCDGVCCAEDEICLNDQCVTCTPVCDGAVCGDDDGCGGKCDGSCSGEGLICLGGECVCEFVECVGVCCDSGESCVDGVCTPCTPDCDGKWCGDFDGCSGMCDGPCPGDYEVCNGGFCICEFEMCFGICCGANESCVGQVCVPN